MDKTEALKLLNEYAIEQQRIADIREEIPALGEAEERAEALKKQIQEFVKENGEISGSGYAVKISARTSWDGKALDGYAAAHPEINQFKKATLAASVKKA